MGLSRYGQALSTPGLRQLFAWSAIGRLPSSMISLGLVLGVVQSGASYALAGTVAAAFAVSAGLSAPFLARLVDRRGQAVILLPTALATLCASMVLAGLPADAPNVALISAAAMLGLAWPPIGGCTRALLRTLCADDQKSQSAFALDATLSETLSILGPLVVVAIAWLVGVKTVALVAGTLVCIGTLGVASTQPSRNARGSHLPSTSRPSRVRTAVSPRIAILLATVLLMFIGFSATEVAVVAAARRAGGNGTVGALLAVWSVGSVLGGLVYGSWKWRGTIGARLPIALGTMAITTSLLIPTGAPLLMGATLFVCGASCAPSLSMIYSAVSNTAPAGTVTEAFAWLASSTTVGAAIGATVAGTLIAHFGAGTAFAAAAIAIGLSGVVVVVNSSKITWHQEIDTSFALATPD